MGFRTRPGVEQLRIPSSPEIGDLIVMVDIAGQPALPVLDGSNLFNVTATVSVDETLIDDLTGDVVTANGYILVDN